MDSALIPENLVKDELVEDAAKYVCPNRVETFRMLGSVPLMSRREDDFRSIMVSVVLLEFSWRGKFIYFHSLRGRIGKGIAPVGFHSYADFILSHDASQVFHVRNRDIFFPAGFPQLPGKHPDGDDQQEDDEGDEGFFHDYNLKYC